MFIIIDGIDGSGKSTIVEEWINYFKSLGKKCLNLREFWKTHHRHPEPEEFLQYDCILSSEPTFVGVGSVIREELIRQGSNYPPLSTAMAYALDRLILYKKVIIPFLESSPNKIVIKDRSVSTSLCYQSIQGTIPMEEIAKIEGNAFALEHAPNYLIITDLPVDTALSRLTARTDKNDNSIFERKDFLESSRALYLSEPYQKLFERYGTKIHVLNTGENIDIMKAESIKLLQSIIQYAHIN